MSEKRRKYTQEFKDSAVNLVTEQGYQLSEAVFFAKESGNGID